MRRLSGQMNWVASQTRPNVSYVVCQISNIGKHPKVKMLIEANKSLTKLKSKDITISFSNIGNPGVSA